MLPRPWIALLALTACHPTPMTKPEAPSSTTSPEPVPASTATDAPTEEETHPEPEGDAAEAPSDPEPQGGQGGLGGPGTGTGGGGDGNVFGSGFGTGWHGKASDLQLRIGELSIQGGLAAPLVQRELAKRRGHMRYCYAQGLKRDPKLAGRILMELRLDDDGQVVGSRSVPASEHARGTDLPDAATVACVLHIVSATRFPQPSLAGGVTIGVPVVLGSH